MKRGNDIGLEEASYVAQRHLLERAGKRESGAVYEDIHAPVVGVDLLDESGNSGLIGDVEGAGPQAPCSQGMEGSRIAAGREHNIISGLQPVRGRLTDAARRPRDQSSGRGFHPVRAPRKIVAIRWADEDLRRAERSFVQCKGSESIDQQPRNRPGTDSVNVTSCA